MIYINNRTIGVFLILTFLLVIQYNVNGQEVLSLEDAKQHALDNNYNTRISALNLSLIENNTRLIKSGNKPTLGLTSGVFGNLNSSIVKIRSATENANSWLAPSINANISLAGQYRLWDGDRISNQVKQNEAAVYQAELSQDATNENILFQVENIYYNILLLQDRERLLEENIEISQKREQRAKYANTYGQSNKLVLLNAQVDLNRDNLNLINFQQQVVNLKRNLNLLLNRDIDVEYSLEDDFDVNTNAYSLEDYLRDSEKYNINILLAKQALEVSAYDQAINESSLRPQVFANASYGINYLDNLSDNFINAAFQTDYSLSDGLKLGVTASWNLIDGGRTRLLNQNSILKIQTQELLLGQTEDRNKTLLTNAWSDYQNAIKLYLLEKDNVKITIENFNYSADLFKQGQINSITYRQSQLNLLNARLQLSAARYDTLLLELDLRSLSGMLRQE